MFNKDREIYRPEITTPKNQKYDVTTLTLGQMIFVMTNYCMNFDQIKEMTIDQMLETFVRINAGEIQTWEQHRQEQEKKREAARERGKSR